MTSEVTITEVGLRDGLQNQTKHLSTDHKIKVGSGLIKAGIKRLEATSFVSPRAVPQLADAEALVKKLKQNNEIILEALVPNQRGGERATDVDIWVTFISASEKHSLANSNCSISEAFERISVLPKMAAQVGAKVAAAIAVAFDCPFEGETPIGQVINLAKRFEDIGVSTLKLGDTIGSASPRRVTGLLEALNSEVPRMEIVLHFHDTRGLGIANIMTGMQCGVTRFETSAGGIGGCPFAPGASGNVATEDVVHFLNLEGVQTGINLERLIKVSSLLTNYLNTQSFAHLQNASPVGVLQDFDNALKAIG